MSKKFNTSSSVTLEQAWDFVFENFPFDGYIPEARKSSYFEMPLSVSKYLDKGALILDFGAGPCDKTAMLSLTGYEVIAYDDFGDDWHNIGDNKNRILEFARRAHIDYVEPNFEGEFAFPENHFDGIILNNVIEHFHDSPGPLLNVLLKSLKVGGYIFIAIPNAVNMRKRIDVVLGKTNYPQMAYYYWATPWRGHIREYVKDDLIQLNRFLGLVEEEISTHHYHLDKLRAFQRSIFKIVCRFFPSFRESWLYVGKKPANWTAKLKPNDEEFDMAYGMQYFNYKNEDAASK
jgi:SAM-dependent methyltransferase